MKRTLSSIPGLNREGCGPLHATTAATRRSDERSNKILQAYFKVMDLARDPCIHFQVPEFVMIGTGRCQRILLVEALLGHSLVHANNWNPKRPILFRLHSDRNQHDVKIKIREILSSGSSTVDVELEDFEAELSKWNVDSTNPLEIEYRGYRHCDLLIIETPNLNGDRKSSIDTETKQATKPDHDLPTTTNTQEIEPTNDAQKTSGSRKRASNTSVTKEDCILKWCRPTHRKLIFFDPETTSSTSILERVDMRLGRSILVYNGFSDVSKNFSNSKELNNYLASNVRGRDLDRIFFVDFFSPRILLLDRKEYENDSQEEEEKASCSENLRIDRQYQDNVGVQNLISAIDKETWKIHQYHILGMLNQIHDLTLEASTNLKKCQAQVQLLDLHHLRYIATSFIISLMSVVEKLLSEHMEDRPNKLGQTTSDERAIVGQWIDGNGFITSLPIADVPNGETLLQGGQQLQRLFTEFRLMMESLCLSDIQIDEIGTLVGAVHFNSSSLLQISAELVSSTITKQLKPLVNHLIFYAQTLLKNTLKHALHSVVDTYNPSDALSKPHSDYYLARSELQYSHIPDVPTTISINDFPYYVHHVKVHYFSIVEQLAQHCHKQCMDEFLCVQFFSWDQLSLLPHARDKKKFDLSRFIECIRICSEKLFASIKAQLTRNVLLKCYDTFLNPMNSPLWAEAQASMSLFSDSELHGLFQLSIKRDQYLKEETRLDAKYHECQQREYKFQEASNILSHFLKA